MIGSSLQTHAPNDWVLGRNPFDVSLLIGSGHGDAAYMFFYAIRLPPHWYRTRVVRSCRWGHFSAVWRALNSPCRAGEGSVRLAIEWRPSQPWAGSDPTPPLGLALASVWGPPLA